MKISQLQNLSKQQKQQIILAAMVIGGILYAFWQFGIHPILREQQKTQERIGELEKQQRNEKVLLESRDATARQYRQIRDRMREALQQHLPPHENPAGWVSEFIGLAASEAGLQETDLAYGESTSGKDFITRKGKDLPPSLLEEFRTTVRFISNYHRLGRFVAALERRSPYVHIDNIVLDKQAAKKEGENLAVSLECVFPRFSRATFPASADPDAPLPVAPGTKSTEGDGE